MGIPSAVNADIDAPRATTFVVSMAEALERLLPHCDNKPHKVAARLNAQQGDGDVVLLGGGVAMAPDANPLMLTVKAHIPPDGRAFLYVQVNQGLNGDYSIWDGETVSSLRRHHEFWAFERESFDDHFPRGPIPHKPVLSETAPTAPVSNEPVSNEPVSNKLVSDRSKNRGGREREFDVEMLLTEALVYLAIEGELPKHVTGDNSLHEKLELQLGAECPKRARFSEFFGPIYNRIEDERRRRHTEVERARRPTEAKRLR
jgi:hypothetical protein